MEMPSQASPRRAHVRAGTALSCASKLKSSSLQSNIRAELAGASTCSALSVTIESSAPVISLCRRLIEAGHDPATAMQVFRGDVLALTVRAIGEAARLEINAKGTGFVARHAVRIAPPIAPSAPPRTGTHEAAE
jgi:hypothetical protein